MSLAHRWNTHQNDTDEQAQAAASGVAHVAEDQRANRAGHEADCWCSRAKGRQANRKTVLVCPVSTVPVNVGGHRPAWHMPDGCGSVASVGMLTCKDAPNGECLHCWV